MVVEAPCVDAHAECSNWAKADECRNNPGFMLESCKRACGVCQPDEPKPATADTEELSSTALTITATIILATVILIWLLWRRAPPTPQASALREKRLRKYAESFEPLPDAAAASAPASAVVSARAATRSAESDVRESWAAHPTAAAQQRPSRAAAAPAPPPAEPQEPRPSVRESWANRPAASPPHNATSNAQSHWTAAFAASPPDALRRFSSTRGGVLLIALEGNDASSLHLVQHVWPDKTIQSLLSEPQVSALRIDGGGSRAKHAAEARFWEAELATVVPAIVLVYGVRGCVAVRERRLEPSYLAQKLRLAMAAAATEDEATHAAGHHSSTTAAAAAASSSRADGLLARYTHAASRDFRPPTPPPTQRQIDEMYAQELDAAYQASLEPTRPPSASGSRRRRRAARGGGGSGGGGARAPSGGRGGARAA